MKTTPFKIYSYITIKLGFFGRLKVLFCKEIQVNIDIETDKEVAVLGSQSKTTIVPVIKLKPKHNLMQQAVSQPPKSN